MELQGESKKAISPTFDDELIEDTQSWLVNINKYFKIYEYNDNLKVRLTICQFQGNVMLCWEHLKEVQGVDEQGITCERFE